MPYDASTNVNILTNTTKHTVLGQMRHEKEQKNLLDHKVTNNQKIDSKTCATSTCSVIHNIPSGKTFAGYDA